MDFNEQLKLGVKAAENMTVNGKFDRVILCGMGGSRLPAEMLSLLWLDNLNLYIHHAFGLPHWANARCLTVCVSWSGDTEETLSSLSEAKERGLPVVAITQGGQMAKICQERGLSCITLPGGKNLPARYGSIQMLGALLTLLNRSAIIDFNIPSLDWSAPAPVAWTKDLAGKTPLIYSSYQWRYLSGFWKILFNEDCKLPAFSNYFPEAAHNELAGFTATQSKTYFPIILLDPEEDPRDQAKLKKFSAFLKVRNVNHPVLALTGQSRLEKILNNYQLALAVAEDLAKIMGVNPLDNSTIEEFKQS